MEKSIYNVCLKFKEQIQEDEKRIAVIDERVTCVQVLAKADTSEEDADQTLQELEDELAELQ